MRKAIANSDGTPLTVDIDRVFRRLDDLLDNDSRQPFRVNRNGNLVLKNEAITPDMGNPQVAFIADVYNLLREIKQ
jgi:hypothetical protein